MSYPSQNDSHFYFCDAIEKRDKIMVQNLINSGVNVNASVRGNTLLDWAIIKSKDLDIMTMLLDEGVDIHAKNQNNSKPLFVAIQYNKTEAALLLIKRGALIGENLNSLLLMAIDKNNPAIIKMLIDHGMQYNPSIDSKISLKAAISRGHPEMIEYIIPHCRSLESSDKYIPRELVIKSEPQYKKCVELLLEWNFAINPYSNYDEDFIYAAVEKGYLPIVLQLLKMGINVEIVNSNTGLNLLAVACLNKHHEIVENLLQHNANVNMKTFSKYGTLINQWYTYCDTRNSLNIFPSGHEKHLSNITCLHIAVFNSDPIMTKLLLKYGAKISDDPTLLNITAIAVENDCEEIVRIFLNHGVNVNETDLRGRTLLHFCVDVHVNIRNSSIKCKTTLKVLQLLLEYQANIEAVDTDGWTPLLVACSHGNITSIEYLLENYANPNVANYEGQTSLHLSCKLECPTTSKIIQLLLAYGANIDAVDAEDWTPLFLTCSLGNIAAVKCLLEHRANPNVQNYEGQTPLHVRSKLESKKTPIIIQLLLEYGANIEAVDAKGQTPLLIACDNYNWDAIRCLLDHNANVNHTDSESSTPLHIAVKHAGTTIVEDLVKYGANVNILDKKKRTPLQYAVENILSYKINPDDSRLSLCQIEIDCWKYGIIIKILVSQEIKLKTAGLTVNNRSCNIVCNLNDYITIDEVKYSAIDILQLNVASNFNDDKINNIGFARIKNSIGDIRKIEMKCQQEIEKMKTESVGINNLTFYDLLKQNIHLLGKCVENEEIEKIVKQDTYNKKFPLYIYIVRNRLRYAKFRYRRYELRISARKYFKLIINQQLPDDCIDAVLSYLSVKELEEFIKTVEQI